MTTTASRTATTTLRQELRVFAASANARIITAALVTALIARAVVGGWVLDDLAVTGVILAVHPFSEWVIHVGVLHLRPRRIGPWTLDPQLARRHRLHHADPTNPRYILIPVASLLVGMVLGVAAFLVFMPALGPALTGIAAATALLLVYEWTHTLIHSTYRPRSRLYRAVWRAHRLHHYKNENYWFGVTMHGADRVLGTYPDPSQVETSPTARSLTPA